MPIKPPKLDLDSTLQQLQKNSPELLPKYLAWSTPLDAKGRYLPFSEFRYRTPQGIQPEIAWQFMRHARATQSVPVVETDEPKLTATLFLTPQIQQTISLVDQHTTTPMLMWINNQLGEQRNLEFLFSNLIDDETISSSQLEGAATTTQVAKELLKTKRKPRTVDERMIVGNYKLMTYAWENRHQPLSCELIQAFHHIGVEGINNATYQPGQLRGNDSVVVTNADGDIVHQPPTHKGLKQRLELLAQWINTQGDMHGEYMHPLMKAIILHFSIGYEHPFRDGNGRVARALFYWLMFKHGYPAFRYIAISTLLNKAPVKYGKSYLYTEHDNLDLTYFVDYQCHTITRAIKQFVETYQTAIKSIGAFDQFLFESGLFAKLSEHERVIFQVAHSGIAQQLTATQVAENLNRSYNTAATALNNLVKLGLFEKTKRGREWVYSIKSTDNIIRDWK